jgi:threonine dehydrogenase-like Zn-dependent dehydrogenase
MKALVKIAKGPGNIGVREVDRPLLPAENWVIIQVKSGRRLRYRPAHLA